MTEIYKGFLILIFLKFYPLGKERVNEISGEIERFHAEKAEKMEKMEKLKA